MRKGGEESKKNYLDVENFILNLKLKNNLVQNLNYDNMTLVYVLFNLFLHFNI